MFTKGVDGHRPECRRHDAAPPEGGSKPVPDLSSDALDIAVTRISNAANGPVVYGDGKPGARLHRDGDAQERRGVSGGIRMRKRIAHVLPDPPIVGMLCQRHRVLWTPIAHGAWRKGDHHRDVTSESVATDRNGLDTIAEAGDHRSALCDRSLDRWQR